MVTQNSVALERGGYIAAADLAETVPESEQGALCWCLFNRLCTEQGNPSWLVWNGGGMARMIPDDRRRDTREALHYFSTPSDVLAYVFATGHGQRQNTKLRGTTALTQRGSNDVLESKVRFRDR